MENKNSRNKRIDVMRGILIAMVVWGHCSLPGTKFVYLFHMAVFIMISGYFYKAKARSIKELILVLVKMVRKYWLQYVVPVIGITIFVYILKSEYRDLYIPEEDIYLFYLQNGLFIKIIKELLMINTGPFTGQLWFIRNLMIVHVSFTIIDYFIFVTTSSIRNRYIIHYLVGISLLVSGYFLNIYGQESPMAYNVQRAMMTYVIYLLGFTFNSILDDCSNNIMLFIITIPILLSGCKYPKISVVSAQIVNPAFFIVVSLCGWIFINYLSELLSKIKLLLKVLSFLGENSYYIFVLHFLMMWIYDITFKDKGYILGRFLFGIIVPVSFYLIVKQIGLMAKESKKN